MTDTPNRPDNSAGNDQLVETLEEIAQRFSKIAQRRPYEEEVADDEDPQHKQTRDRIECWADALKTIIYELRDERGASDEVVRMLLSLVGGLADLSSGQHTPLRELPGTRGGSLSEALTLTRALTVVAMDCLMDAGATLNEAADAVRRDLGKAELQPIPYQAHSNQTSVQQLINLRREVHRAAPETPVGVKYAKHRQRHANEEPVKRAEIALNELHLLAGIVDISP